VAIAPSKLGKFVVQAGFSWPTSDSASPEHYNASDDAVVQGLREKGLLGAEVTDAEVIATFRAARDEHTTHGYSPYNSPNERVRVFLQPYLSEKGRRWAEPLESLNLPDEEGPETRRWWKFWER
jgi:hypothetical protein